MSNTQPDIQPGAKRETLLRWLPWAAALAAALWLAVSLIPLGGHDGPYDLDTFAKLPVSYGGRFKPIDSVARNSLLILNNKQSFDDDGRRVTALPWLLSVMAKPEQAHDYKVFRVDNPEVRAVFDAQDTHEKRFSFRQIMTQREELNRQGELASQVEPEQRSVFQKKLLELIQHLNLYAGLIQHAELHVVPGEGGKLPWKTLRSEMDRVGMNNPLPGIGGDYTAMLIARHDGDAGGFNRAAAQLLAGLRADHPSKAWYANVETHFNRYAPFYKAMWLYVFIGLAVFVAWLAPTLESGWGKTLLRAAAMVLLVTLVLHTLGILTRVYLSGRPPVTNLYSSAIFIGWGIVVLGLILERLFKNGMGTLTAAVTGALSLLIAQGLAADGDTLAVLQAVLDTNFWLATHVVVVTLGYAATFLAGFLGIIFVIRGVFTRGLTEQDTKRIGQMIYGIVCFAVLFSFVGTILGGIWADQSWGRFWGWDPKENGAILIVLWNALMLHARWGGMVRTRGLAVLAIFGNIVTSWSWFGTNMLGTGLHSYGFIDQALFWIFAFVSSQILLIGVGLLPIDAWRSFPAVDPKRAKELRRRGTPPGAGTGSASSTATQPHTRTSPHQPGIANAPDQ